MKKIFSVAFTYLNYKSKAIISVAQNEDQSYYHIQFIDKGINHLLFTQHIRYKGDDGYKYLDLYLHPSCRELLEVINSAIRKELRRTTPIIKRLFPIYY
jgi:alpha-galactosidase/6-phospho-beta-glucosidase family protein